VTSVESEAEMARRRPAVVNRRAGRMAAKRHKQAVGWDRYLQSRWAGLNVTL
jgi:hypothetical protein